MMTEAPVSRHAFLPLRPNGPFTVIVSTGLLLFAGVNLAGLNARTTAAAPSSTLTLYAAEDSWIDAEHAVGNHGADINLEAGRILSRAAYDHQTQVL